MHAWEHALRAKGFELTLDFSCMGLNDPEHGQHLGTSSEVRVFLYGPAASSQRPAASSWQQEDGDEQAQSAELLVISCLSTLRSTITEGLIF